MHAQIQKVLSEGVFLGVFLVDEGREDQNTTIAGHHRPASGTPFKWRFTGEPMMAIECWLGSFVILRGSGPTLLGNPIFYCFFMGGGGGGGGGGLHPLYPLWICAWDGKNKGAHPYPLLFPLGKV